MPEPPHKRPRFLTWAVCLILSLPAALLLASEVGFFPWSSINCTREEVDIHAGRVRHSRYLLFVAVRQVVMDSSLTKVLAPDEAAFLGPEWHCAVTLSPGLRHSPHYAFHGAVAQIRELEGVWVLAQFTPAARRASAKRVLALWQRAGNDSAATDYLRELSRLASADDSTNRRIDEGDLPRL